MQITLIDKRVREGSCDRDQNKTKLKSKIELNQCFWSILCYSEFLVIKSMYSSWKNQWIKLISMNSLFLGTIFGPCWDYI